MKSTPTQQIANADGYGQRRALNSGVWSMTLNSALPLQEVVRLNCHELILLRVAPLRVKKWHIHSLVVGEQRNIDDKNDTGRTGEEGEG